MPWSFINLVIVIGMPYFSQKDKTFFDTSILSKSDIICLLFSQYSLIKKARQHYAIRKTYLKIVAN
jgi:hypothetical protein